MEVFMDDLNIDAELRPSLNQLSVDELRALAGGLEDLMSIEQFELYVYCHALIYQVSRSKEALDQAILLAEGWLADTPEDNPDYRRRSDIYNGLAALAHQYDANRQDIQYIAAAAAWSQNDGRGSPPVGIGTQVLSLENQARGLEKTYHQTRDIKHMDEAVRTMEFAVNLMDNHVVPSVLGNLASMLLQRFIATDSIDDLSRAIELELKALDATPEEDQEYIIHICNLTQMLKERAERTGSIEDSDLAIEIGTKGKDTVHLSPFNHSFLFYCIGASLNERFKRGGSRQDLEEAIVMMFRAVDLIPRHHINYVFYLRLLTDMLSLKFDLTGDIEDNNRAIEVATKALEAVPDTDADHSLYLSNLSNRYEVRSDQLGSIEDLNRAIEFASKALDPMPRDDSNRHIILINRARRLTKRYDRLGARGDLDHAIQESILLRDLIPEDHPRHHSALFLLGGQLCRRFQLTKSMVDLDDAIDNLTAAANKPLDSQNYGAGLAELGLTLYIRFQEKQSMEDLDRAIEISEKALKLISQNHTSYVTSLDGLASMLCERFERLERFEGVERTEEQTSGLLGRMGYPPFSALDDLAAFVPLRRSSDSKIRWKRIGDLDRAIDLTETASKAALFRGTLHYATLSGRLAQRLEMRYKWTQSEADSNRRLACLLDGWNCTAAHPSDRIKVAIAASRFLASKGDWKRASEIIKTAVSLFATRSPRYLDRTDAQSVLAGIPGISSIAAALSLNAKDTAQDALQILELGRGIIAGLLMDMRGDISNLKKEHPELAEKFISLRDELDSPISSPLPFSLGGYTPSWESTLKRRREATLEFDKVIKEIRAQPRLNNFLQQPPAGDLMAAADRGPIIVINSNLEYRSDAFLVTSDRIEVIELPHFTLECMEDELRGDKYTDTLEWLWHAVCRPCLDALGFKEPVVDDNWPHVWWVLTGFLSWCPLHAAGIYSNASRDTVMDRVISSYASSIRALLHSRQLHPRSNGEEPEPDSALLVAMRDTPGSPAPASLPYANQEVNMMSELCPSLQLNAVTPHRTKDDILRHLKGCKVFHFAGHGESNRKDPSKSCLLLDDWEYNPLTVSDLWDSRLYENPPFLAYLSACSTGSNEAIALFDEGIHLVGAFQLAGFRHVIGTLWGVSDKHCLDVARILYETLRDEGMTDTAVSRGLHFALRALRDGQMNDTEIRDGKVIGLEASGARTMTDLFWVPYVHFGA
ncbi:CHAT domain-containing protein [Hypomontagnella monticulosa]|nr:CHAT domain-containing protein [Hypomontagnella monticulosa]